MKNPTLSPRQKASNTLTSRFTRKLPLLLALAFSLALASNLRAGIMWFDPDGDPSNNSTNGTGTGALGSAGLPIGPDAWESTLWTDDSNLPTSITNALVNFNEGDDVIFWGTQVGNAAPDIAITLAAPHTVNSLSFYSTLSAATTFNYWILGGSPNNLTNTSGVINCDGGAAGNTTSSVILETTIQVPLATTNGLQTHGNGIVIFATNMALSGGQIVINGFTRPGATGGIKLPTAAQWNTSANGAYKPFPSNSQIILTNGATLTLNGTAVTSSVPIVIWDGLIAGAGGVFAPEYILRTCRFGNNTMAEVLNDDGTGNAFLYKTGAEFFQITAANGYKGGTIISQGGLQFTAASTATTSALGSNTVTMGDTNTGSLDIGLMRSSTAASSATTNLFSKIVVTTNGTGRVFIGNQAMASFMRFSGPLSLGRSVILGGSGTGVNGAFSSTIGATFTNTISGVGGVTVQGVAGAFATPAADVAAGGFSTSQNWFSGGTVQLTSSSNTYSGGSTVLWGTLEGTANGSLGAGNVYVYGPAILKLDAAAAIAPTANLIMGTNSGTPAGSNAVANLNYSGTCTINALSLDGGVTSATPGIWGPVGSAATNQSSRLIGTGTLTVVSTLTNTTSTLVSSANPVNLNTNYGQSVTLSATVASATTGTPTGTVTFNNGATALGTSALSGGAASLTTGSLPAGTNLITANYNGDGNFLQSVSSALSEVIYTNLSTNITTLGISNSEPGKFQIAFQGTPGAYYSVVTATNLATLMSNWTVVPGSGTLVTDLVAGNWVITVTNTDSTRYYRAKGFGQ